ncbi:hypothetical protein [Nocardioides sp.]|uniref:hypothetical protein n=1 Tax=Nocardioides sp. TaxID=35761 RepID=UPI002B270E72|nr:hypothetical protein [Nocardioides sp.]
MLHGLPRRSTAIVAGALLLSGSLSSCGFGLATDRVNTISSGVNDRDGEVDVLAAAIISAAPDSGVFVATFANANQQVPIALTGVGGEATPIEALDPLVVEPQAAQSLYQLGGIPISGDVGLGDFVSLELTFDSGQTTTIEVAVMRPCYEYDPAKFPGMVLPGAEEDAESGESAESHSEDEDHSEGHSADDTDPYSCEPLEPVAHGEGEEEE